jgi:hypothetical protein
MSCKKKNVRIEKEPQLLQVIAVNLLVDPRRRTGHELKFLRGACQLTQTDLAAKLKLGRRETIADREARPGVANESFSDEVVMRWVLLSSFREHLRDDSNNFLANDDRSLLADFHDFFEDFSKRYVKRVLAAKLEVALKGDSWKLAIAA